jgi:hypothetical protein
MWDRPQIVKCLLSDVECDWQLVDIFIPHRTADISQSVVSEVYMPQKLRIAWSGEYNHADL